MLYYYYSTNVPQHHHYQPYSLASSILSLSYHILVHVHSAIAYTNLFPSLPWRVPALTYIIDDLKKEIILF